MEPNQELKDYVLMLRERRMTWEDIGVLLGVSRQRAEQISKWRRPVLQSAPVGSCERFHEEIRARDDWTCQICFKNWSPGTRRFDVHHLEPEMEGRHQELAVLEYDRRHPERLVTLCRACHSGMEHIRSKMKAGRRKRTAGEG